MKAEAEADVQILLDKLDRWLLLQPEWVRLMGLPERQVRKQVARLVAEELLLMPVSPPSPTPGRQLRRQIVRELEKSEREWFRGTGVDRSAGFDIGGEG